MKRTIWRIEQLSRRDFISVASGASAGLLLGLRAVQADENPTDSVRLNPFLQIEANGRARIFAPCTELGQGSLTGLAVILAEELEVPWSSVVVEPAPLGVDYRNPASGMQGTGDSRSIREFFDPLRRAGAAAREMLVAVAMQRWNASRNDCSVQDGHVIHGASGRSLPFATLVDAAAGLPVPSDPPLKSKSEFRLIGQRVWRADSSAKVDGTARFGIDVNVPGQLVAAVKTAPSFGGDVLAFDEAQFSGRPGFHSIERIPGGVAVLAEKFWQAQAYLKELSVTFSDGPMKDRTHASIEAYLRDSLDRKDGVQGDGRGEPRLWTDGPTFAVADYEVPFLAHASMEPINCVAHVRADGCDVWGPIQSQDRTASVVEHLTGLDRSSITINTTFAGGAFGRLSVPDFVVQAVTLSKATGRPVKVIWNREEDLQHDFYRPAAAIRMQAKTNRNSGRVDALRGIVATSTASDVLPKLMPDYYQTWSAEQLASWRSTEIGNTPYDFPNIETQWVNTDIGVPVGYWRSVDHSFTVFAMESFMDELAHLSGVDTLTYRLDLLGKAPRAAAVLALAAEKADWGTPLKGGHGRGVALQMGFGSPVAQVAEVAVDQESGRLELRRIVCAVDCGIAVLPDQVEAQMTGAILFGLTAAIHGRITVDGGVVAQSNYHNYRILGMADTPDIEVHIIESGGDPGGVGESGTPPIAPAVTNAVFAATGRRIRSLPLGLTV